MLHYSFIDFGIKDFLRKGNKIIMLEFPHHEAAEEWLLTFGEDFGWTNSGVRFWCWEEEEG